MAALPWNRWQPSHGISGSFAVESVAGLLWNQWQLSCGTGGSFAVESVAGFTWNRWQLCRGIRTYAAMQTAFHAASRMVSAPRTLFGRLSIPGTPPLASL